MFGGVFTTAPAGQDRVQLRETAVPPWFSEQVKVCVASVAPSVQVPASGPPVTPLSLPTAVTVWPKPENGAVGAVQVSVVVAAAPVPLPTVAIDGVIVRVPVDPMVVPPVAATVEPVAGV